MTPTDSRLVRTVPATVVAPRWLEEPSPVKAIEQSHDLSVDEVERLTQFSARRPVELIEFFDECEIERLRFVRWLALSGRCRP